MAFAIGELDISIFLPMAKWELLRFPKKADIL